jgi:ribosome assembly protein RRB1
VFAASGDDDQTTIWDIAVEKDVDDDEMTSSAQEDVPAQLLFIHMGQKHVKEVP